MPKAERSAMRRGMITGQELVGTPPTEGDMSKSRSSSAVPPSSNMESKRDAGGLVGNTEASTVESELVREGSSCTGLGDPNGNEGDAAESTAASPTEMEFRVLTGSLLSRARRAASLSS